MSNSGIKRLYLPRDAAALSVGADEVCSALQLAAAKCNVELEIVRTGSRGLLWLEPLLEVETGPADSSTRIGYGPVTLNQIDSLLDAIMSDTQDHKLCLGPVEEIPYLKRQERLTFARCGVIDPVSVEDYLSHGGYDGLRRALALDSSTIIEQVTESGLRGRGGAAFPAGIKWRTVADAPADRKYICANADEGDSGTFADRMLMEGDPLCLLEGMTIAGLAVGAEYGYIYVRSEYPNAIRILREAIEVANAEGWLGNDIQGSGRNFQIEVRKGAGAYICGEETAMLESLEGKRGMIRFKPPLPAIEGLFGQPTVVNNILTLASVPTILAKGADFYRDFGQGRSRGTQPFQLAGNIRYGGLVEKAFGISLRELIEAFGGGTRSGQPIRAVQVGGPLGAYIPADGLDVAADYEVMQEAGAMLGHGGIVVFDDSVDMLAQARFAMKFCADESCGKCTPCRIGSQRGVEVIDRIVDNLDRVGNIALLKELCELMETGSLCAMGGMTPYPVMSALRHFPEDFGVSSEERQSMEATA
jgi:formate dehydrogenase iron-sulfur subunit